MLNNKKIVVVMPAYNAEATLEKTYNEIPKDFIDEIILVDDFSKDNTVNIAKQLNIKTICHSKNMGYGANQKTCYNEALKIGADITIMLHPDYQYNPKLIPAMASMIAYNNYDFVIASRFLTGNAKKSKMPRYKYFANRFLTSFQNILLNKDLSEYHSGYRAFNSEILKKIDYNSLSNDFIFDNELITLICRNNFSIGEISTPARYFNEASSINFKNSCKYGLGVLFISIKFFLNKAKNKISKYLLQDWEQ